MSKKLDKILNLFLTGSYSKFNVREVARLTKLSPSTASKYLNRLVEKDILKKVAERNYILYSADTESEQFRDLKIYHNIKRIRLSGVIDFIEKEFNYPEAILLFGSFAKGENRKESDVDLFILSESEQRLELEPFEKKLEAKIQILLYTRRDVEKMKKSNKELLNNIINGITLSGFFEVFK